MNKTLFAAMSGGAFGLVLGVGGNHARVRATFKLLNSIRLSDAVDGDDEP